MKNLPLIFTTSFLLALTATDILWADDHGRAYTLRQQGDIMPLETIIQRARLRPDERIIEVELEEEDGRMVYELELLGPDGIVRERLFDAKSGKLITEKQEDD